MWFVGPIAVAVISATSILVSGGFDGSYWRCAAIGFLTATAYIVGYVDHMLRRHQGP